MNNIITVSPEVFEARAAQERAKCITESKKATYCNGRYYVHGFKTDRGFSVVVGKRSQWKRGAGEWISRNSYETYAKAAEAFKIGREQVDQIVSAKAAKTSDRNGKRSIAIAAYKANTPLPWKVGDMGYTSYGYDQTNISAYEVVAIKSRTSIMVRPIGGHSEETGFMCGRFTPEKGKFIGDAFKVTGGFHFWVHGGTVSENWMVDGHSLNATEKGKSHYFSSYA